jgi:hypothetical protein
MKIDEFLPRYDYSEVHEIFIPVSPDKAYDALKKTDLSQSWMTRVLVSLRGIRSAQSHLFIDEVFTALSDEPGKEIVWGMVAQPWTPSGHVQHVNKEEFDRFEQKDYVKMVWNASFHKSEGGTLARTETRILGMSPSSKKKFGIYWFFIKPFSGIIRKEMLKLVKKQSIS